MSDYSSTSFGDLAVYALFALVSLFSGGVVIAFFVVATAPLVSIYPAGSGAQEVVLGVAILWGVVIGCVVAVFTLGPWHRHRARGRLRNFHEEDELPLAPVRPVRRRSRPARRAAQEFDEFDDDGLLILAEEDEPRGPARSRYAREY